MGLEGPAVGGPTGPGPGHRARCGLAPWLGHAPAEHRPTDLQPAGPGSARRSRPSGSRRTTGAARVVKGCWGAPIGRPSPGASANARLNCRGGVRPRLLPARRTVFVRGSTSHRTEAEFHDLVIRLARRLVPLSEAGARSAVVDRALAPGIEPRSKYDPSIRIDDFVVHPPPVRLNFARQCVRFRLLCGNSRDDIQETGTVNVDVPDVGSCGRDPISSDPLSLYHGTFRRILRTSLPLTVHCSSVYPSSDPRGGPAQNRESPAHATAR